MFQGTNRNRPNNKKKTYIGYTPRKHQIAVHDAIIDKKGITVVVKSRRQSGKSFMCLNLLLYYAITNNSSTSMLISVTLAQSRKIFKEMVDAIQSTGVIKKMNEQTLEIQLINKSIIYFKSNEQNGEALRGYTIRDGILILDECSFLSEDLLEAVLPFTNVHKSPILMVSTPKFKNCFFYRYFMRGLDPNDEKVVSIDWNDYDLSEFLSDEQIEEYKQMLPQNQFKTEILGHFLDDEGVVFTNYKECVRAHQNDYKKVFVGVDWSSGTGNDYTSISILNEYCEQVDYISFNNLNTTQTIDRITNILETYNNNKVRVELVLSESNSIGTPLTQLLTQANPKIRIEAVATTNKSKEQYVSDLQLAFEKGTISILNNPQQINEIGSYEAVYNPKTKNVSYNAPQGLHDDSVISLMLSLQAYKKGNNKTKYMLV